MIGYICPSGSFGHIRAVKLYPALAFGRQASISSRTLLGLQWVDYRLMGQPRPNVSFRE